MGDIGLNRDYKLRDSIVFGEYDKEKYSGGVRRFEKLCLDKLKKLIDLMFADPEECQNCSPTIKEFVSFMEFHPEFTAHGYVVDVNRSDYRVSVEGVDASGVTKDKFKETLIDFVDMFRYADDFVFDEDNGSFYCWYD